MEQQDLDFTAARFGGSDYDPSRDMSRMSDALGRVYHVLKRAPETWYTLSEISDLSEVPQSSVGSYLCYLRRDYNYTVPKRYIEDGLYQYKLGRLFTAPELLERGSKNAAPDGYILIKESDIPEGFAYQIQVAGDRESPVSSVEAWATFRKAANILAKAMEDNKK